VTLVEENRGMCICVIERYHIIIERVDYHDFVGLMNVISIVEEFNKVVFEG
jgi:hypothetical protein